MSLRPLAAVFVLMLGDWALWTWSIGADHGLVSLFAGLMMAPLFVAFAWLATMVMAGGVRTLAARLLPPPPRARPPRQEPAPGQPVAEQEQRIAA